MIENTPTTEAAGAAVPNDTKFQCKISENQPTNQIDERENSPVDEELEYLREMAENPTEPPIDKSHIGLLHIKEANEWIMEAALRPDPKPLWMSLWYEGECSCLFADSNLGKSVYACQIANEIAKDEPILYCDFELSDKQFQLRFTNQENGNRYIFPANFKRAEISLDENYSSGADFEDEVIDSIEAAAKAHNIKVIIIDNLTWICNSSEKGDAAGQLMARLIRLKKIHQWSILVIAHTPKRALTTPIDQNTLAGSKKLMNFFDSAFAIGRSARDENLRYVKQIKCRYGQFEYGADNVIIADISQDPSGYLHFNQLRFDKERNHLKEVTEKDENATESKVIELHQQGKTQREIANEVGVSVGKVNKIIKSKN